MTDETTRPEDTEPEGDETTTDDVTADEVEEALAALDADDDPDEHAGDLTDPDIDLSFLEVQEDEDGGDDDGS